MLTIGEIRAGARAFAKEWEGETREDAERQTFWNEWFAIFGIRRRRFVVFERNIKKLSGNTGRIDAFWPGMLLIEHKSADGDLDAAMAQAEGYFDSLEEEELPRLIVSSDFKRFRVLNLETSAETEFPLHELPERIELFTFLAGYRPRWFVEQDEVDVKAAQMMSVLHSRLADSGYEGHALRLMLVRLLFILFADDTGIWGEAGLFEDYIERKTAADGSDLGMRIEAVFEVLDQPPNQRQATLPEPLTEFPYVNGQLFQERLPIAAFDREMRDTLLATCRFNWSKISPAIFGSMFQGVMTVKERRAIGAHYTTEQNIMKALGPLFLDELQDRLDTAGHDRHRLRSLFQDLRAMRFLDPACGCGNFLVIAYREVRRIELEVLKRLQALDPKVRTGQMSANVSLLSQVDVDQFLGIEYEEFPARIAEVAMYLMDHLANQELSQEFGLSYARIPLHAPATIKVGNALRMDWDQLVPATDCDYVLGNPPFVAKKRRNDEQVADMDRIFGGKTVLDYVAAWFEKAARYIAGTDCRVAFVATNSIVQGEQVPELWPSLLDRGIVIDFAHRTFRWTSEAPGRAAVHVVIIGFSEGGAPRPKVLFDYERPNSDPHERVVGQINPYLADAPADVIPVRRRAPLLPVPPIRFGSMPNDDGNLLLDAEEKDRLCDSDPIAAKYVRSLLGADGMLDGDQRWCLWLTNADPADVRQSPELQRRVAAVKKYREASKRKATRKLRDTPGLFGEIRQPAARFLCIPRHSSMYRRFIPAIFVEPETIAHDSTLTIEGADAYLFGVLHSSMWMAWVRAIGGRLKSDYRVSSEMVYNTFPWPDAPTGPARQRVADASQSVISARAAHPEATLADLYDPLAMPNDLVAAHRDLDAVTDALFGRGSFDELKRLAALLRRYESLTSVLATPRRRARSTAPP